VYLLVFHACITEMHGSRSKIPSEKFPPYIYDVKCLALLGAPYIYDISGLRVTCRKNQREVRLKTELRMDIKLMNNPRVLTVD
jgi:hypothetical protein